MYACRKWEIEWVEQNETDENLFKHMQADRVQGILLQNTGYYIEDECNDQLNEY